MLDIEFWVNCGFFLFFHGCFHGVCKNFCSILQFDPITFGIWQFQNSLLMHYSDTQTQNREMEAQQQTRLYIYK